MKRLNEILIFFNKFWKLKNSNLYWNKSFLLEIEETDEDVNDF